MSQTAATLLFCLGLLISGLAAAPLFVERLRTERVEWAQREEHRKLYDAVSGKVMITYGDRWDIIEPNPGIIPEGTLVLMQPSAFDTQIPSAMPPLFSWEDSVQPWHHTLPWSMYLNQPQSFIPPSVT